MTWKRIHGESRPPSTEYRSWCHMIRRCELPTATGYKNYGGRQRNRKHETDACENEINKEGSNELYAVYIGHQPNGIGGGFDLFNVVDPSRDKNVLHGSTVGIKTILKLGIKRILDKKGNPIKLGEDTKGGII